MRKVQSQPLKRDPLADGASQLVLLDLGVLELPCQTASMNPGDGARTAAGGDPLFLSILVVSSPADPAHLRSGLSFGKDLLCRHQREMQRRRRSESSTGA
jgi:hypothetical protein